MSPGVPLAVGWASALLLTALDGRRRAVGVLAVVLGIATVATLLLLAAEVARQGTVVTVTGDWPREVGIALRADALGLFFATASVVLVVVVLAFEVARGAQTPTFPALALYMATGLTGLFLTGDVFNFYVFFEVAMVTGFALAGYGGGAAESRAAAVFVLINLVGSAVFLGAVAMLYRATGTLDMAGAAAAAAPTSVRLVIAALILAAFGMKLGLFPFHYWLPVVYRESRPAVAALFAGPLAAIGGYGLLRFGGELFHDVLDDARGALLVLGGASVLYGGLVAIRRPVLRDVIAYSSISQAGLLVLALSIGGPGGFVAATLNSLANALHKTCLFLAVGSSASGRSTALMVAGLSVAGLPPMVGFAGKVALLRAAVADANAAAVALVVLGSALSYVYVARAWRRFRPLRREPAPAPRRTASPLLLGALLAAILGLGVWPATVVGWSERAAACVGVSK